MDATTAALLGVFGGAFIGLAGGLAQARMNRTTAVRQLEAQHRHDRLMASDERRQRRREAAYSEYLGVSWRQMGWAHEVRVRGRIHPIRSPICRCVYPRPNWLKSPRS